ncbi:hypothetical protein SCALM49S_08179 [Streptomyces californicus]
MLSVGGTFLETRAEGLVRDLTQRRPIEVTPCTKGGTVELAATSTTVEAGDAGPLVITDVTLGTGDSGAAATPRPVESVRGDGDRRTVSVGAGREVSYLQIHENHNEGWKATLEPGRSWRRCGSTALVLAPAAVRGGCGPGRAVGLAAPLSYAAGRRGSTRLGLIGAGVAAPGAGGRLSRPQLGCHRAAAVSPRPGAARAAGLVRSAGRAPCWGTRTAAAARAVPGTWPRLLGDVVTGTATRRRACRLLRDPAGLVASGDRHTLRQARRSPPRWGDAGQANLDVGRGTVRRRRRGPALPGTG